MDSRRNTFKKNVSFEEARRSRTETQVQIRKNKKQEQLLKRRMAAGGVVGVEPTTLQPPSGSDDLSEILKHVQVYHSFAHDQTSATDDDLFVATQSIRRILNKEQPPIAQVVQAGALPFLSKLLTKKDQPAIQFEAAWALTNVAAVSSFTKAVVDSGAVPYLNNLLVNDNPEVREQAAWCIGNIAGEGGMYRDGLLRTPYLTLRLCNNLADSPTPAFAANIAWAISGLCRGKPAPDLQLISPCIEPLIAVLNQCQKDSYVVTEQDPQVDILWALSYITDGENDRIQAVIDNKKVDAVAVLLHSLRSSFDNFKILTPTVMTVANMLSGTNDQTDVVLKGGFLQYAWKLLNSKSKQVRKQTCFALSNIAAGTLDQIEAIFRASGKSYGVVCSLVDLSTRGSFEVKKEAVWAICNIINVGSDQHGQMAVTCGALSTLCGMLGIHSEVKLVKEALQALEKLLVLSETHGLDYVQKVEEEDGIEALESLQEHPDDDIYNMAVAMIVRFFGGVEEEEDMDEANSQNQVPVRVGEETFEFGLSAKNLFGPNNNSSSGALQFNFGGSNIANL